MRVRVLEEPMQYSTEIRISVEAALSRGDYAQLFCVVSLTDGLAWRTADSHEDDDRPRTH
jgi:hypothetical protein